MGRARYTPGVSSESPSAIIITDGGLPALVAAAIEAERAITGSGGDGGQSRSVGLMPWPSCAGLAAVQCAAVASLARFFRFDLIEMPRICAEGPEISVGLFETLALLAGVEAARGAGCCRVIWPVQYHADRDSLPSQLDRIAAAVDRALLVSRLGLLDGEGSSGGGAGEEITIETPLVDLTDRQIADLVVDLDAPAYLCWWWRQLGEPEAEAVASVERGVWLAALGEAGWVQALPGVSVATQTPSHAEG
ncbi:hypothetical protein MNBD_PLANCTO03-1615 [hydrothermal vent metagenome]|uniref:Uncharacterized protein n=1 Tax=hydrothermal vent metagenome TaxID=652676 RepID=A0A3B1DIM0_9ZZZZ